MSHRTTTALSCAALLLLGAAPARARGPFERNALKVPGRVADLAAEDFTGDGELDLLVVHVTGLPPDQTVRLSLFRGPKDGPPSRQPDATIPAPRGAVAFDVAEVDGAPGQEIVLLHHTGLSVISLPDGSFGPPRPWLKLDNLVRDAEPGNLPRVPLAAELDGEDRPPWLLVPTLQGLVAVPPRPAGAAAAPPEPQLLRARLRTSYSTNFTRRGPQAGALRVQVAVPEAAVGDQDGDGTNDLFLLWRDKGQVFTRDAAGRFGVEPAAEYDLDIETKTEKRERNAWISPRLLDLNADGVSDLVMIKTAGGMMNMLSSVYVFPGQPGGGFPAKPAQLLTREAFTPVLLFHDVNHDQAKDLIVAAVEIGLVAASQVLLTGSLTVDFDIHLNAQGTFPGTPQATVEIPFQINFKRAADIQGLPPVFGHDFNGDGINDLAHGRGEDALEIYLGAPQEEALFGSHFRVRLKVPPTPYLQATDAARPGLVLFYRNRPELEHRIYWFRNRNPW